jgi:GT2 family glycosyltransferase
MYRARKIVVVMPAYNAARTLKTTYDEVVDQGIVDKVILVDDGSRDGGRRAGAGRGAASPSECPLPATMSADVAASNARSHCRDHCGCNASPPLRNHTSFTPGGSQAFLEGRDNSV